MTAKMGYRDMSFFMTEQKSQDGKAMSDQCRGFVSARNDPRDAKSSHGSMPSKV